MMPTPSPALSDTMPLLANPTEPVFFNIKFNGVATATPVFTLTSETSGLQLQSCTLDGNAGTMTIGVQATASPFLCYQRL